MATKGLHYTPLGTDGSDHSFRQKVSSQYQISATNKSRLKNCIFLHYFLFIAMLAKLSSDILDKLDIFILEIEELRIPKPLWWEYIWCTSLLFSFLGLSAIRTSRAKPMKHYLIGLFLFGFLPLVYASIYYYGDAWRYLTGSEQTSRSVPLWLGMPYGLLWYAFILLAFQVHAFSAYFAWNLLKAWTPRKRD